jgi:hypothetical protein
LFVKAILIQSQIYFQCRSKVLLDHKKEQNKTQTLFVKAIL